MQLLEEVKNNFKEAHNKYKGQADKKRRQKEFEARELVMARLGKGRTPAGSYSKLQDMKISPFRICHKMGPNAYVLDLPEDLQFSSTFKVSDVFESPDNSQMFENESGGQSFQERGNDAGV